MMEQLDLRRHMPEQFAGKSVTMSDRNYMIGPKFGDDDGYAHFLINELSGLCLHFLRIGKEYRSNPSGTLAASREKARQTAPLRNNMLRNGAAITLPFMSVIEGNGGSFELHETTWGAFGHTEDSPGREAIDLALAQSQAGDQRSAVAVLTALLEKHPNHSVAIGFLGGVLCDMQEQASAEQMFARSIEIEPNYAKCLGQQIIVALRGIHRRRALDLFLELKARYPLLDDYDGVGISAHLICGEPEQALQLLQNNTLPSQDANQLLTQINCALEVKQLLAKLGEGMVQGQIGEADLLGYLEDLYKAYPLDPLIQANLGCALYRSGQYQRACELLDSAGEGIADELLMCFCAVNLAFAFFGIGAWEPGLEILADIMGAMSETAKANFTKNPINTPGLVDWFAEKGVLRSRRNSNYQVLAAAMAACPDQALITPQIRQLAELYRQAAAVSRPAMGAAGAATSAHANPTAATTSPKTTAAPTANTIAVPPAAVASPTAAAGPRSDEVPLATSHPEYTATLLVSGKVLFAGGFGEDGIGVPASAELYDPSINCWSTAAPLPKACHGHTATLLPDGRVLVAGGEGNSGDLTGAELYDPSGNSWSTVAPLQTPRKWHTATLLASGKVLVTGGAAQLELPCQR
jgi:tetratricopeptide (TPR) repeat protein